MSDAYHHWKLLHPAFETVTVEEAFEAGAALAATDAFECGKQAGEQSGFDDGYDQGKSEYQDRTRVRLKDIATAVQGALDAL